MADPLDDPQAFPRTARRIGYSSRGNASPVGETEAPLTLGNPRDQERETSALRRRYETRRAEEIKDENVRREADFRTRGVKHYVDARGRIQPELDEGGNVRFTETAWKKGRDESGAPALVRRNARGETEYRKPKITASGDIRDPNLYYDFGDEGKEAVGHVDDLIRHADPDVARAAGQHRLSRNQAIRKESLKPLQESFSAVENELLSARLRRTNLDGEIAKLNEQIAALDSNPAINQKAGGVFGIGAEPTGEARRLQAQRSALQSQLDGLTRESAELGTSIDKGGALYRKHEQAKLELDLWSNKSKVGELEDLAEQRRVILRSQNRSEKDDPVLSQILAQQEAFGVRASEAQKRKDELEAAFTAEREKAAAEKDVLTEEQLRTHAVGLEERRKTVEAAFSRLNEDAAAGRLDPATATAARQSLVEFERDYARSAGQLAGKADAFLRQQGIESAKARRVVAQGEQLYSLEKNAGSMLQRIAEGTRDKEGSQRKLLSQSAEIREAAKAAAFHAGDAEYSQDLYAKLPGKNIAIHPNAFTIAGHKAEGSSEPLTWRDAIDQAVNAGHLDGRRAESMRRELAVREKIANEAAIDATLDNEVFRRWVAKTRPDLAKVHLLGWHSADYLVEASNPELRGAALEFLKAEPSASQKIWNGLKMVGVGAINVGSEALRAVLPEDGSGEKAVKEIADGLNGMAMDPRLDKHWMSLIGQGLGSSLAFATPAGAAGGLAQGVGMSAKAAKWTVGGVIAATGGAAQGQAMYDEAKQSGASEEVADGARWLGMILGASEVAPLASIVRRAGSAKAFTLAKAIKDGVAEIGEEVIQEVGQTSGSNAVARMLYDQNREVFEGILESAQAAGGSAAIMSLLGAVAGGIRYRRTVDTLHAVTQSREQSEARLAATMTRPEVQAVAHLLPPVSQVTAHFAAQRAQWQQAIQQEAAKKNPNEDQLLFLHEQLAQLEIANGSASRALASHAVDLANAMAQAKAAPDYVPPPNSPNLQVDQVTGQPVPIPGLANANRDGVAALVKIANGVPIANLTEGEQQALQAVGADLQTEMVRDVGGQPVITDKAREWALNLAPAAGSLIRQSETERIETLNAVATSPAKTKPKRDEVQKEKGRQDLPLTPSVTPADAASSRAPAGGASVTFTDEAGKQQRAEIPAGAVVPSTKAPVRDQATAEQYLAETRKGAVRDVQFSPPAAKPKANRGTVKASAILPHLVQPMRAKGAKDVDIATAAVGVATRVNAALDRYRALFGGRIEVSDEAAGTGGFRYDSDRDALVISTSDLATEAGVITSNEDRVGQLVREEAIHRAAVRLEKRGDWKADQLWDSLTPTTRDAFVRAYNRGRSEQEGARTTDSWAMGHEMVRMLVQGRLSIQGGKLAIDGAAISEETASPTLIQRIADILRKIREYFTDLAGTLQKDGNRPETVAEVQRVVDMLTGRLQALEQLAAGPQTTPAGENTIETVEGEQINEKWTEFAPESGTLGVPRVEMPQFKSEHRGALVQFLAGKGIKHSVEKVLPGTLKPTQREYSPQKVDKARKFNPAQSRPILVSGDDYVLDGHHQFVAALTDAPQTPYPIIRFNAPIAELFDAVTDFPSVTYSSGSTSKPGGASPSPESPQATRDITPTSGAAAKAETPALDSARRASIARELGIQPDQVGSLETVTHKGKTVETVNIVIEADQANTSHNPDGSLRPDYPQELQPRDRSSAVYQNQQRLIAANPNWREEMLTGTPDRGTPIMAKVGNQVVTVIGNGRANAKALMYASPDLEDVAENFWKQAVQRGPEKGISSQAVGRLQKPVFARYIVERMPLDELRAFSQASNEFAGAATNAIEQARVDASRLTPEVLAFFNPEYDLDASRNDEFRREFVRQVIGRAENITGPDLRRRVQAALFAKAFGDTDAGMAAFSRLAGEDDEGVRNLVRAMLDVAPEFVAMRSRIEAGTLYPLDIAPAVTRAVQDIAVALRERPSNQPADVALDALVNQGELTPRDPLDQALLQFLVDNRRNRSRLADGLSAYVAQVYAAGDPRQTDMFGAAAPNALETFTAAQQAQNSEGALASAPGYDPEQGRWAAEQIQGKTAEDIIKQWFKPADMTALEQYEGILSSKVEEFRPIWEPWLRKQESALTRFLNGTRLAGRAVGLRDSYDPGDQPVRFYARKSIKNPVRIVEKAVFEDSDKPPAVAIAGVKDALAATFVLETRADMDRATDALMKAFRIDASKLDPKRTIDNPIPAAAGYRDDKLRPTITEDGIRAEIILITPGIENVKQRHGGHVIYEVQRRVRAIITALGYHPQNLIRLRDEILMPASQYLYDRAWASDSGRYLASQSALDTSLEDQTAEPGTKLPSGVIGRAPSRLPDSSNTGTSANALSSPARSTASKNRVPGGNLSSAASISSTSTSNQGGRQPPVAITSQNIGDYAGNVDVSGLRGRQGRLWTLFDRSKLDRETGRLIRIDRLVSPKNELQDPKFLAGVKRDPRQNATNAMVRRLTGDDKSPGRAPIDVTPLADGRFGIIDGNATAQALMLAGWTVIPANVRTNVLASGSGATEDDLFAWASQQPEGAPLTPEPSARNETQPTDAPARPKSTPATRRKNRGRAFTPSESDDLGPLFAFSGSQGSPDDEGATAATPTGDVGGVEASQPGSGATGTGDVPAGLQPDAAGTPVGSQDGRVPVNVPSGGNRPGGRVDPRAAAEARRLARATRYRGLAPEAKNHRITDADTIVEGGAKTRIRNNIAAIRLLKTLQAEGRRATPDEKRVLAKYVGWGALPQVFNKDLEGIADEIEYYRDLAEQTERDAARLRMPWYQEQAKRYRDEMEKRQRLDKQWGEGYRALKELLTPEEWEAARTSTENAHYTDRGVITAMWEAVRSMGFKGGRVIEPAGGVGHFYGLMPEDMMEGSELFGVELDTISGGIFAALYPDAQVQVTGFEKAKLPDNAFDLAISNVPFSEIGPFDPLHDKAKLNLHNYFFAKALDKVRPGGLVAFITTSHTLESQPRQRAYLAERADFVGAVRLPNNAFAKNAGTEVTTDIVFLRKRDGIASAPFAEGWLNKEKVGDDQIPFLDGSGTRSVPITVNEYFARHPEMVLGTHSMNGEMYAGPSKNGQYTVKPIPGADLATQIEEAISRLPEAYTESGEAPQVVVTNTNARNGAFLYRDGELGIFQNGAWTSLAEADPANFGEGKAKNRRKAADFVRLRDYYRAHLALMAHPTTSDAQVAESIEKLAAHYDSFVGQWGTLEKDRGRHKMLKTDPDFWIVRGLEVVEDRIDPNTGEMSETIRKADVLTKRTIWPRVAPTEASSPLDALRISQAWKGRLDLDFMSELLGVDTETTREQLIESGLAFENPRTGLLETRNDYLSGKVRMKLRQAEEAAKNNPAYQRNVDALREVQPPPVPPRQITPKLGGGWVPPPLVEAFLRQLGFRDVSVSYTQVGEHDKWTVKSDSYSEANEKYSGGGMSGLQLLQYALDQRTPQIFRTVKDGNKESRKLDATATAGAQAAMKRLVDEWEKWAKGDAVVTIELDGKEVTAPVAEITAQAFNEQFNGTIPKVFDGSHLTLPGSAPFLLGPAEKGGLRQHQKNGIWRAVQEGVAFLAHGVGAGKTRELIAIAMEWKRLGLAKKPMLVVHNPTLNQYRNEIRKIYPGANVLVATKQDLEKENRRAWAARVASGDWDMVVIAHSSFNIIDDDPKVVEAFIQAQKKEIEEAIRNRQAEIGSKKEADRDPTVKQLVKMLRALEQRLLKAAQMKTKDASVFFQELGVDGLLIDEAHLFKKVPFVSKMGQVAGLDMGSSARASNLLMRLNHIREKTNGRNVVLATGTPITNTLAEIWNMIRLTSPETLKEFGVPTFDSFAASFGRVENSLEMNPAGKWVPRKRFARFVNGTGLAAFVRSIMDVQLNLELGQPKIADGGISPVVTPRTPTLNAYMQHLEGIYEQWQELEGEDKALYSAIPLVISGVAKAATMDMRLIDPKLPDEPGSKVNRAIENVVRLYNQERERRGVQIIFADQYQQISTSYLDDFAEGNFEPPVAEDVDEDAEAEDAVDENGFNLYRDIRTKLIDRGIPAGEIAIATDFDTDEKRAELFAKANVGAVRILLGSTQKLGVGVNVQERLYAEHHLDTPWTPADLEQRIGRMWRNGNRYAEWGIEVRNFAYGVEKTMDAGRYQLIEKKARFSKQAMEGKAGVEFDDPAGGMVDAAAELKAQFTGDPRVMEKTSLENQIRELELQASAHDDRRRSFEQELRSNEAGERIARAALEKIARDKARLTEVQARGFTPAELDELDERIEAVKNDILKDGALQQENARIVYNRDLAPGLNLRIYAKGEVRAQAEGNKSPIAIRVNAVLIPDENANHGIDKGITSEGAKGILVLIQRAIDRETALAQGNEVALASAIAKQATARVEMARPFAAAEELSQLRARLAEIDADLTGRGSTQAGKPLEEGRGPRGERAPVTSLASGQGQLDFEELTAEELAAADRAIEAANRAELVRTNIGLADKIANQFRIPGYEPGDIRQEARTALIIAAREYQPTRGAFAPFAGAIIRNRLRDVFNKAVRRVRTQGVSADEPNEEGATILDATDSGDDTRIGAERAETARLLQQAMKALPERHATILRERADGKTFEEIGRALGLTKQRVKVLADNAMAVVRAQLRNAGVMGFDNGVLASGSGTNDSDARFTTALDALSAGTWDVSRDIPVGDTPNVLIASGADALPIVVSPSVIRKVTTDKHALSFSLLKQIPDALRDPIFVFDSATVPDAQTVITDLRLGTSNVLIALHLNRRSGRTEVNRIASIYGKTNELAVPGWISAGLLRYAHQQKSRAWFQSRGLQLPKEGTKRGNPNLITEADIVNPGGLASGIGISPEDEAAIAELMAELARDVPSDGIDAALRRGATETEGEQTVGRPDLANPAGPDAQSRRVMNAVDEARNETLERETHEQWRQEALHQIARDRAGVLRDLLTSAQEGVGLDNPVKVKAAQLLVNDLIQRAVTSKDAEAMRQAQVLAWSYREAGTEQARSLAARRDPFKRPADRYREFLAGAVFTPTPKLRKELKSAWSPAEKQRRIATLRKQLADARAEAENARASAGSVPADVQRTISRLNVALGEALQKKDRVELLNTSLNERMKRIDAELKKMGVTLDDIFAGEAYLRLRGAAIDNNIFDTANYDAVKRRVLSLIKKGWSNDYIANKTGLSAAQVSKFEQEHIETLRARLAQFGDDALDPEKLDTLNLAAGAGTLAAGEGTLSPEERAKRIDAMIQAMGYGRGAQRERRTRRAAPARRRAPRAEPTPTPTAGATEPGRAPEFPPATGRTRPDRGNRQLDLEETGTEQPPGAEFPTDATGQPNPYDFAGEDAAPPVFDISDPVQVAQASRVIQAIDSNAFDMVSEFWVNSILSAPLTQGANIIGNTANTVWDFTFKRFGEAAVNSLVRDPGAPHMAEFRHMLRAVQPAIARAWRNALRTWTAETSMFENDVLNIQIELGSDFDKAGPTRAAIPGKAGRVIRIPGRLLMATDDFFKSWIAHVEAAAQAYRIAKADGLTGDALESRIAGLVNLPGSAAWTAAVSKAEELTFQSKHEGKPAGQMLRLLANVREFDIGGGIKPLRFILPFVRTPFNIFGQGLRQSPAGMALLLARFARAGFYKFKNGRPIAESYPRSEMIKHSVEQLIAWTVAALIYGAAAGDDDDEEKPILITGSIPYKDSGDNALNQRTGNQPFTIRVGDVMVSYGRVEPFATILGTTVDAIRAIKTSRRAGSGFDAVGALMQSLSQQIEEKTFLRGIADLIGAARGERRGERESYVANFLASWVPNLIRQPLRELDPVFRERGGSFTEKLSANVIPQTAEPKIDAFGEPVQRPGLAAWRALIPVQVRQTPEVNRIDRLLTNWNQAHPEDAWAPRPLSRTIRLNAKESHQLTGAELREYATKSGRMAAQMLRAAALNVENPSEEDLRRVQNAFSTAATIVKRQMFGARAQEIGSN